MKNRYSCPVGFWDHNSSIFAPLAAIPYGADDSVAMLPQIRLENGRIRF